MSRAALLLALLAAPAALAQPSAAPAADPARGAQLAASCAACHGHNGEGLPAGGLPRLAGQPAAYLAKQLRDFADGSRSNAVMQNFAKALAAQDVADLGAYYAGLKAPAVHAESEAKAAAPPAAPVAVSARQLANLGDARLGVQACANCHGPDGRGEPPLLPYLAGQNADYLAAQLQAWQSGARANDGGEQMASVARKLDAAAVAAVAAYFAGLPPPE